MKSFLLINILLSFLFFTGCAIKPLNKPSHIEIKSEIIQNYQINKKNSVFVGETILENGYSTFKESEIKGYKALKTIHDIKCSFNACNVKIDKNHIYYVTAKNNFNNSNLLYIPKWCEGWNCNPIYIQINNDGSLFSDKILLPGDQGFGQKFFEKEDMESRIFEPNIKKYKEYLKGSNKYELIYNGVDNDNTLKILYREYKNNFIKPAFSQVLSYSLKKNNIIRFKNFKVKILEANNEELIYLILKD